MFGGVIVFVFNPLAAAYAVGVKLRVSFGESLEAALAFFEVGAIRAENAAGTTAASTVQLLTVAHEYVVVEAVLVTRYNVAVNGSDRNVEAFYIRRDILLQPEAHRLAYGLA